MNSETHKRNINAFMLVFRGMWDLDRQKEGFVLDEQYITGKIEDLSKMFPEAMDDETKIDLKRKIEADYGIYQADGEFILDGYVHDREWFKKLKEDLNHELYYWDRYEQYLAADVGLPPAVTETLGKTTMPELMSLVGDPNSLDPFAIRGLVVGDVQSGKTSNYIGLMTMAADAGYKVIIVLTGTIEGLRKQTQQRVEEGFIGYDSDEQERVGVGAKFRGNQSIRMPHALTTRKTDFSGNQDQNNSCKIEEDGEPLVLVIKKNVSVLKKVLRSLRKVNLGNDDIGIIDSSLLLIDDEADNASVNTNDEDTDPTQVNKQIRRLLGLFQRNTYVGFTATPFANVFIGHDSEEEMLDDDLFPRNFIYSLSSPSNYLGPKEYFVFGDDEEDDEGDEMIEQNAVNKPLVYIEDSDDNILPYKHSKDFKVTTLFNSNFEAINAFLIANAIRDIRDEDKNTHRSMLINVSRMTNVQSDVKNVVEERLAEIKISIKQTMRLKKDEALKNKNIKDLKDAFEKFYGEVKNGEDEISWDQVFDHLYESTKDIKVKLVNSSRNKDVLNYDEEKNGLRVIVVGGFALSRGLTLNGLMISYLYRNTTTYDVLMQMGRWFGYRDGYADLIKIFVTRATAYYYRKIYETIDAFKKDIAKMAELDKTPKEYGIRIRESSDELMITARNKMRHTKQYEERNSFYGSIFDTPYLDRDISVAEKNVGYTLEFLKGLDLSKKDPNEKIPYFRNVDASQIVDLLDKIEIHEANAKFDKNQIIKFISGQVIEGNIDKFDVALPCGSSEETIDILPGVTVHFPKRYLDTNYNNTVLRVSGQSAHLYSPSDTSHGLNPSQIKEVQRRFTKPVGKDYLNFFPERNPLLVIYLFKPNANEETFKKRRTFGSGTFEDILNVKKDADSSKFGCLVGYAIGFPAKSNVRPGESTLYRVNNYHNYYDNPKEDEDIYEEEY